MWSIRESLKLLLQERNNSMRRSDSRKFCRPHFFVNWSWSCVLQLTWFVKWEQCHLVLTILGCSQETELRAQINHKETKVEVFIANWYTLQSFSMYVDSYPMNWGQLSIQVHSLCESQGSNSQLSWQKPLYVNVQTLSNSLKELQSEKNAGVNVAEWDAQDLKGQLEELRSHHNNFGPTCKLQHSLWEKRRTKSRNVWSSCLRSPKLPSPLLVYRWVLYKVYFWYAGHSRQNALLRGFHTRVPGIADTHSLLM
jgi:hypothetical protein